MELRGLAVASIQNSLGGHGAGRGRRLRIVHQLGEHLNGPRTMGSRQFRDGLIRLRPAGRIAASGPFQIAVQVLAWLFSPCFQPAF